MPWTLSPRRTAFLALLPAWLLTCGGCGQKRPEVQPTEEPQMQHQVQQATIDIQFPESAR